MIHQADAWPDLHRALDRLDAMNVDDLARRALAAREVDQGTVSGPPAQKISVEVRGADLRF